MTPDAYIADARRLINFAAPLIREEMSEDEAIQSLMFVSVGIEKLLKYGLARINPVFIQQSADFKHSAAIYSSRFVPGYSGPDVEKAPNLDVITFRASVGRLKVFSATASKHSQLLHAIASWRDVVMHRPTREVDPIAVGKMLRKDLIPLIESFCIEYGEDFNTFFGAHTADLTYLSGRLVDEEQLHSDMQVLLERHRKEWEEVKKDQGKVDKALIATDRMSNQRGTDYSNETVICPACQQTAIVKVEPQYEYSEDGGYLVGVFADNLLCFYCGLKLDSYDQLDYVDVDALLADINY